MLSDAFEITLFQKLAKVVEVFCECCQFCLDRRVVGFYYIMPDVFRAGGHAGGITYAGAAEWCNGGIAPGGGLCENCGGDVRQMTCACSHLVVFGWGKLQNFGSKFLPECC